MDANVTRGNLKNLVTDKPAPITVALAQTESEAIVSEKGVPVLVNPVVMKDTMADVKLGMEILVGPDEITLQKKKAAAGQAA